MGAVPALAEIRSRLDLAAAPEDSPVAPGYRIVRWTDVAPEGFLDDLGSLDSRLNGDAPVGELAWEPENVDAARIRAGEQAARRRLRTTFQTGAVHEDSGRLVAWTMIGAQRDIAWHAWQNITIVDPGHRGHGLGLTIKKQNSGTPTAAAPACARSTPSTPRSTTTCSGSTGRWASGRWIAGLSGS